MLAFVLLIAAFGLLAATPVQAQEEPAVRVAVRGDSAFVYHTARLPAGHGFHLERISAAGDTTRLTDTPRYSVQEPDVLPARLGPLYAPLRDQLEVDTPMEMYLALRSDRTTRLLSAFLYPEVARLLGHLFVDDDAPIGEAVTYRFVFVDDMGTPTGETLARAVTPAPVSPPAPDDLEAEHTGRTVTLSWSYPQTAPDEDDTVIRFNVYRLATLSDAGGPVETVPERVNGADVVLRNNAVSEFEYTFDVPEAGVDETFYVTAVSITGAEQPSEELTYEVTDNVPPPMLTDVRTVTGDSLPRVELTWPMSSAPDAAGYYVYRAPRMEAEFQRIHDAPLDVLSTVYLDTTVTGGEAYFYRVSVVDEAGNESTPSNPVMAQVTDHVPPPTPRDVTAAFQDDGAVRLQWSVDHTPPDLWTYRVLRRRLDGPRQLPFVQANVGTLQNTAFVDRGGGQENVEARFDEGARYRYAVVAADSARNFSDSVFVDIQIPDRTPPPPPERFSAINEGGLRAVLRWSPGSVPDIVAYNVYRRPLDEDDDRLLAQVEHPRFATQDDSVAVGETYVYTVTAVDSLENESPRTRTDTLQMRDFDPPPAVRNVQAFEQDGRVTVRWDPSPSSDVAGYRVYRSDLATGVYEPVGPDLVRDTQTTLAPDDENIFYRVHAVDTSGNESRPSVPARRHVVSAEN